MMQNLAVGLVFLLTVGSACVVAFSRNLIYSAFALIGTFCGIAAAFILLSADFVGLAQVMVYAGGILILTIFAVMLTSRIESKNTNPISNYKAVVPLMLALIVFLGSIVMTDKWAMKDPELLTHVNTISEIGDSLLGDYLLPFELVSVVLLMSMVGAAIISRRQVKSAQDQE